MVNELLLAVAGSRKTQSIVDHCSTLSHDRRALVVTFTQTNQVELQGRLAVQAGDHPGLQVAGWYTFLLRDFARPFLPFKFPEERVFGFNYEGQPHRKAKGKRRFLDSASWVYASELGRLSHELVEASGGALLRRLQCVYDEILIDEIQDLSSHDWEIMDILLKSSIDIYMVGDIRQAVLSTNPRSRKNKKYAYADAIKWFREREQAGIVRIEEKATTWRCQPEIAEFSDTIFDASLGFPETKSENYRVTGHDGVFLIRPRHVNEYLERYDPKCLRSTANSGKMFDLDYLNFRMAKGMSFERVLIVPTGGITEFIRSGKPLSPIPAASFYVAVTRAEQSVAIVIDAPGSSTLPFWEP